MVTAALLHACGAPSAGPDAEIEDWVQRGVAAVEAKQRATLLDMISPAYADARGNNRSRVGDTLRGYFLRMNTIELVTAVNDITVVDDSAAEVLVTVGMAGKHDGVLGFSADAYQFLLELEKSDGNWALISARWGEPGRELQ